jgi:Uri superfamily endonuclease
MLRPALTAAASAGAPPARPGTYLLLLPCAEGGECRIGRLGALTLRPGVYAYVGSALGPGGLAARLRHHAGPAPRPHWHIDRLRRRLPLAEVWFDDGGGRLEHAWAAALARARGAAPVPRFGCSDCRCATHLLHFPAPLSAAALRRRLKATGAVPRRIAGGRLARWMAEVSLR